MKYNNDDIINKYKIRFVIKNFTQIKKIDFHKTFVFILKFESLRLLFVYTILYNFIVKQINMNNVYFNNDLNKKIYIIISFKYLNIINV